MYSEALIPNVLISIIPVAQQLERLSQSTQND